jgi:muramoyltetrapeptide carboxypeptidase
MGALVRPARLRRGDRVTVIAPSGPLDHDRLERALALLRAAGLDAAESAHARDAAGYLAGTDAARAADLEAAWLDPEVRAVLCGRGGYGAARLLDRLDWTKLAAVEPKILVGSSDVTSLHLAFAQRLGIVTYFGPMAAAEVIAGAAGPDQRTLEHLLITLFEPEQVQVLTGPRVRALAGGLAHGVLTGGTLALLAAAVGTPEPPRCDGGLLLLEDVNEPAYRIDRHLTQLLRSRALDGVRGVVLGSWEGCGDPAVVAAVVVERLGGIGVPILAGFEVGHEWPQLTVPLGVAATMDADLGTLTLDEPALA